MVYNRSKDFWHHPCYAPGMVEGLFTAQNYQLAKAYLEAAEVRHGALSRNLANMNTPGYQRVDLQPDFDLELKRALQQGGARGRLTLNLGVALDPNAREMRPDGNNVKLDQELVEVNRNALQFRTMSQQLDGYYKRLKTAITGRVA